MAKRAITKHSNGVAVTPSAVDQDAANQQRVMELLDRGPDRAAREQNIEAGIWGRVYANQLQVLTGGLKSETPDQLMAQLAPLAGLAQTFADGAIRRLREARKRDFASPPAAPVAPVVPPTNPLEEKHS